eukprot:CAMPEP_0202727932 /NCGR_PEP_ID=MMETSP1385-20130828/185370_1 /ASSEMBLY_ACC=CAM_ASM_000861 /TAXON_ID=933848 /ORGANISM="Elphidium margaritaceum" /LENGTH=485 /DNA_ID=CAMNT_0049394175 /DNA_START=17 /DNA_END=1475 /DNA_ORIENTATION=-
MLLRRCKRCVPGVLTDCKFNASPTAFTQRSYFSSTTKLTSPSVAADFKLTGSLMQDTDPEIYELIEAEKVRQRESILLSPASNYASRSVLDTLQTVLQNKYSEGYPRARYYGGNENVDDAEELTQKRALQLFGLNDAEWKCNVQPQGSFNSILEVLTALTQPHAKIMTPAFHAVSEQKSAVNKFFNILKYDASNLCALAQNYTPQLILSGNGVDAAFDNCTDYALIAQVAKSINAYHACDISDMAGLIAAKLMPSPFEHADVVLCSPFATLEVRAVLPSSSPFEHADVVLCSPFATLRGPRGAAIIFYRSGLSSKIDGAVFPGHQGGPHNHAISAMAAALKMAQTNEFVGYQTRVVENTQCMEDALRKKQYGGVEILSNGGHCLALRGLPNAEGLQKLGKQVNMELFYDAQSTELRISSNAMTTRGLKTSDFQRVIDFFDQLKELSDKVQKNGTEKCQDSMKALKTEVATFAKEFPLVGVDDYDA